MRRYLTWVLGIGILFLNGMYVSADVVTISGRQVLVNGSPYIIKGVCYNPVPVGSDSRDFGNLTEDLELMNEAGINTIRVYSPITDNDVLDEIDHAGIKIIMGFGYNQGGNNDILSGTYLDYINTHKDHDAILFWELGNEYNYHPVWFNNDINNWYNALNDAAYEIHRIDSDHPVSTAHGELPDGNARSSCPDVDIWGMNVYRWDNPEAIFSEWRSVSTLPMYLSETGADSYMTVGQGGYAFGENEAAQADATENILNDVFEAQNTCSGVTLFSFTDEWWKAEDPNNHDVGSGAPNSSGVPYDGTANEEYWGILDVDRNRKMVFDIVKTIYNSISVGVERQQLDAKILFGPNPTDGILTIYSDQISGFELYDISGKLMFKSTRNSINFNSFENGMYFLKIFDDNGIIVIEKVVYLKN